MTTEVKTTVPGNIWKVLVKIGDTVMVDPRTEAVKSRIEDKDYLIVGEHQLLGKW